jgi:CheY-like chemotaxis protein
MKLVVSDTGTGLDPKIMHRIYEPFFTTKGKDKGTGMGLAVVHGIVKELGGDILVTNKPGVGAEFTVILPRVIEQIEVKDAQPPAMPTGKDRVLFVDDDPTLLKLGEKVLKSLGYSVTAVNGSPDALSLYRQSPDSFDIVVTDHTMPHMTGFDMSRRILEIDPQARILLCTGYSDSLTAQKVEDAGIKALLYKPINRNELANVIRNILDG